MRTAFLITALLAAVGACDGEVDDLSSHRQALTDPDEGVQDPLDPGIELPEPEPAGVPTEEATAEAGTATEVPEGVEGATDVGPDPDVLEKQARYLAALQEQDSEWRAAGMSDAERAERRAALKRSIFGH